MVANIPPNRCPIKAHHFGRIYRSIRTDFIRKPQNMGVTVSVNHKILCFAGILYHMNTFTVIAYTQIRIVRPQDAPRTSEDTSMRVLYRPES